VGSEPRPVSLSLYRPDCSTDSLDPTCSISRDRGLIEHQTAGEQCSTDPNGTGFQGLPTLPDHSDVEPPYAKSYPVVSNRLRGNSDCLIMLVSVPNLIGS